MCTQTKHIYVLLRGGQTMSHHYSAGLVPHCHPHLAVTTAAQELLQRALLLLLWPLCDTCNSFAVKTSPTFGWDSLKRLSALRRAHLKSQPAGPLTVSLLGQLRGDPSLWIQDFFPLKTLFTLFSCSGYYIQYMIEAKTVDVCFKSYMHIYQYKYACFYNGCKEVLLLSLGILSRANSFVLHYSKLPFTKFS